MFLIVKGPLSENFTELNSTKLRIGQDSSNNLVLMGSYIGEFHSEIYTKEDKYFYKHLDSTEISRIDGQVVAPNHIYELSLNAQIKIGEFHISLSENYTPSVEDEENEFDGLSDDELLAKIDQVYAKSNKVSKKTQIGSHLEFEQTKSEEQKETSSLNVTQPKSQINRKNNIDKKRLRPNRVKKTKEHTLTGLFLFFCLAIIGTGFVYYTKYYKKNFEKSANLSPKTKEIYHVSLKSLHKKEMGEYHSYFSQYFSIDKCSGDLKEKVCLKLFKDSNQSHNGAILFNNTLVIGINQVVLEKSINRELDNFRLDDSDLAKIIETTYSSYFDFETFKGNGYRPTTQLYKFNAKNYKYVNGLYLKLFSSDLSGILKLPLKNILFFDFTQIKNEILIEDFIYLKDIVTLNKVLKEYNYSLEKTKQFMKYELTEGIESFYQARLASHIAPFDKDKFKTISERKVVEKLINLDLTQNCSNESLKHICNKLIEDFNQKEPRVVQKDGTLFVGLDFDTSLNHFKLLPKDYHYNNIEKSTLIRFMTKQLPEVDKNKFLKSDLLYNISMAELRPSLFYYYFSQLNAELTKLNEISIDKVTMFFHSNKSKQYPILAKTTYDIELLKSINPKTENLNLIFFTRSQVPVFNYKVFHDGEFIEFVKTE